MKKMFSLLLLASVLTLSSTSVYAQKTEEAKTDATQQQQEVEKTEVPTKEEMKKQFEQRLNLSEKQKEKVFYQSK